jgi:hypothetical protein
MNLINRFQYRQLERVTYPSGARHYICPDSGKKLPSVTTILDKTADKKELREWRARVGDKKADEVKNEAVALGSLMHTHLEKHILGEERPGGNNYIRIMAERMADQIIHRGLVNVEEVWGSEVILYAPELYAGTTDLVGIYKGQPAIMDFKTAKKLRTRAMIDDYFHQLCAYGIAHNELYGTDIRTGVIFMVSRDYDFEEFIIEHGEFEDYKMKFLDRFTQFITT